MQGATNLLNAEAPSHVLRDLSVRLVTTEMFTYLGLGI